MIKRLRQPDEIAHTIRKVIAYCPERNWTPKQISAEALVKAFSPKGETVNIYGFFKPEPEPRGFLIGFVVDDPTTGEKTGSEMCWFVVPEYRGTGAAKQLLGTFEQDAKEAGATRMLAGFSMFVHAVKMNKLYRHLGYQPHLVTVSKKI